jgi:hypothetical protein
VGKDLFGVWLVEMSYGRIGTIGRAKVRSFATTDEALAQVNACLRKRATAPRRIGVAYHVRSVTKSLPPDLPMSASPNPLGRFVPPLSSCSQADMMAAGRRGPFDVEDGCGFLDLHLTARQ